MAVALRYKIESATITLQTVTPTFDGLFEDSPEREQVYFRRSIRNAVTFKGADYTTLIALEETICEEVTLTIERQCTGGSYVAFWEGVFTLQDATINKDQCFIRVKCIPNDEYKCFLVAQKEEQNVFALDLVEARGYNGFYNLECYKSVSLIDCETEATPEPPDLAEWCAEPESDVCNQYTNEEGDTVWERVVCYDRLTFPGTCSGGTPSPPGNSLSDWTLLENDCPTSSTYFRCPNNSNVFFKYSTGRWFADVLTEMIETGLGCGLTLVSNFFDVNADATNPSNDAYTYAATYLQSLTFHQKSDIKRPYNSNPALSTVWNLKLKDLLDDLRIAFNVYYKIEGTTFRLEHASYFAAVAGLDLTGRSLKNVYENDYSDQPKEEQYFYADQECSTAFQSQHIQYECGEDPREYRLKLFSFDVGFISDIYQKEVVADSGFVLISTFDSGGTNYITDDNLPLSWPYLHENLHLHRKASESLTINGTPTTALTFRKQRKAPAIITRLCCDDDFDAADTITTDMGEADVDTAELNVLREHVTLKLKY